MPDWKVQDAQGINPTGCAVIHAFATFVITGLHIYILVYIVCKSFMMIYTFSIQIRILYVPFSSLLENPPTVFKHPNLAKTY